MNRKQWWTFSVVFFILAIILRTLGETYYNTALIIITLDATNFYFLISRMYYLSAYVIMTLSIGFGMAGSFEKPECKKK